MLIVFLDTEFTNFDDPHLISIGLASSKDEEFYAETHYPDASCSDFVHKVVIPLLSLTHQLSHEQLRMEILEWFNGIRGTDPVVVCFDSHYDETLFRRLFQNTPPSFLIFRGIGSQHINALMRDEFYFKNGLIEHHALSDAKALRYSFRGWFRSIR